MREYPVQGTVLLLPEVSLSPRGLQFAEQAGALSQTHALRWHWGSPRDRPQSYRVSAVPTQRTAAPRGQASLALESGYGHTRTAHTSLFSPSHS